MVYRRGRGRALAGSAEHRGLLANIEKPPTAEAWLVLGFSKSLEWETQRLYYLLSYLDGGSPKGSFRADKCTYTFKILYPMKALLHDTPLPVDFVY